jgi:hypothetical protein
LARCFEIEMGGLNVNEEKGVPLEHLISCVKGVGIVSVAGHKRLQWSGKNDQLQDNGIRCIIHKQKMLLNYNFF